MVKELDKIVDVVLLQIKKDKELEKLIIEPLLRVANNDVYLYNYENGSKRNSGIDELYINSLKSIKQLILGIGSKYNFDVDPSSDVNQDTYYLYQNIIGTAIKRISQPTFQGDNVMLPFIQCFVATKVAINIIRNNNLDKNMINDLTTLGMTCNDYITMLLGMVKFD